MKRKERTKMRKTIVAILASLAMVITMIPLSAVTVSAGTPAPTSYDFTLYYNSAKGTMHKNSLGGEEVTTDEVPGWSGSGSTLKLNGFDFTTTAGTALVVPGGDNH